MKRRPGGRPSSVLLAVYILNIRPGENRSGRFSAVGFLLLLLLLLRHFSLFLSYIHFRPVRWSVYQTQVEFLETGISGLDLN